MTKLTFSERFKAIFTGAVPERLIPPPRKVTIEPVKPRPVGSWNGMTFSMWQDSPDHIKFAQELYKQPHFRDLLAVVNNATPSIAAKELDPTRAAYELGRVKGYQELFSMLLIMPRFPAASAPEVAADYGAEEENDEG